MIRTKVWIPGCRPRTVEQGPGTGPGNSIKDQGPAPWNRTLTRIRNENPDLGSGQGPKKPDQDRNRTLKSEKRSGIGKGQGPRTRNKDHY